MSIDKRQLRLQQEGLSEDITIFFALLYANKSDEAKKQMEQIVSALQYSYTLCDENRVDPHLRDSDLSALGISSELTTSFDRIIVKQAQESIEDQQWLDAEQGA